MYCSVANSGEGAAIINEVIKSTHDNRLPVISHWGIVAGNFTDLVSAEQRQGHDISFIHTCFAFTNLQQNELADKVFTNLKRYTNGDIKHPNDLKTAVGFIHAYDLTKILIQAIRQAGLTGNITNDREAIRLALEDLRAPVDGLVKTYRKPFSVFNENTNPNGHEALNADSYCMGKFGPNNEVLITEK